jgi:hypothetical protein
LALAICHNSRVLDLKFSEHALFLGDLSDRWSKLQKSFSALTIRIVVLLGERAMGTTVLGATSPELLAKGSTSQSKGDF